MKSKPLIVHLSNEFNRYMSANIDHSEKGRDAIELLCREFMPSGSGFDSGTRFDFDKSRANRFVFVTDFHHMDENGYYEGWTHHEITVIPTFTGFDISRISGRDRNGIKDYIADTFYCALATEVCA